MKQPPVGRNRRFKVYQCGCIACRSKPLSERVWINKDTEFFTLLTIFTVSSTFQQAIQSRKK